VAYVVQADGQIAGLDLDQDDLGNDDRVQYIGDVAVHYLKRGESISKTAPGSSDTEFGQFNEVTTRQICTARNISYELGISDASKTNYSSFRASLQKDYKRIAADQASQRVILDWMFELWMEVEILSGRLTGVPYVKFKQEPWVYTKKLYITPELITVDPLKERLAEAQAVKLNRTTESILAHRAGLDYEEIIAQKAEEQRILKEYGMAINPDTGELASEESINQFSDTASDVKQEDYVIESEQAKAALELLKERAADGDDTAIDILVDLNML
jgi:capsid protein